MRLRIVSDGSADGTRVVDEDGRTLEGVAAVTWQVNQDRTVTATLVLREVAVDIAAEYTPKTTVVTCPICDARYEVPSRDLARKADVVGTNARWRCGTCGKGSFAEDWFSTEGMN
jgi:hypothetical protein